MCGELAGQRHAELGITHEIVAVEDESLVVVQIVDVVAIRFSP